ncbi:MAG TPA: hypothetical protein VMW23_03330 [Sedimentisphaerales bacterium]|nr:hypothetical protein [Sedimentisphaerales bacterium]
MDVPGLVDLQVNGYKGVDFSSPDLNRQDFITACEGILQSGTAAFLPTIITSPAEVFEKNLKIIALALDEPQFRHRVLGIHLEGPFISATDGARGAHQAEWVVKPSIDFFDKLLDWADGKIKVLTIAAELDGADELARYAAEKKITVALGHQTAGEDDLDKLVLAGAKALTHLGNGTAKNLDRHKNTIWAGLANDQLTATIITDGHHLPPAVIKTFIRAKGISRCIVVSDGSPLVGLPAGRYKASGNDVVLDVSGRLYNPNTGYMVGSSATMLQCMNFLASLNLLSAEQLVQVGFFNPLKLIGVNANDIKPLVELSFDQRKNRFAVHK